MDDLNKTELLPKQIEPSVAGAPSRAVHTNEEAFRAGQSRILEMIAANVPHGEILKRFLRTA